MIQFIKKFLLSERVFKNYITSIIAVLIVAAYFGLAYSEKSSGIELTAVITLAGMFLRSKDSLIGKNDKGAS